MSQPESLHYRKLEKTVKNKFFNLFHVSLIENMW